MGSWAVRATGPAEVAGGASKRRHVRLAGGVHHSGGPYGLATGSAFHEHTTDGIFLHDGARDLGGENESDIAIEELAQRKLLKTVVVDDRQLVHAIPRPLPIVPAAGECKRRDATTGLQLGEERAHCPAETGLQQRRVLPHVVARAEPGPVVASDAAVTVDEHGRGAFARCRQRREDPRDASSRDNDISFVDDRRAAGRNGHGGNCGGHSPIMAIARRRSK